MIYAHTSVKEDTSAGEDKWEPLSKHLTLVAELCAQYCREAYLDEREGFCTGLCHDLGKAGHLFQEVLHGRATKIDHESPGAYWVMKKLGPPAYDMALAIHGHHKGLVSDSLKEFADLIRVDKRKEHDGRRYSCDSKTIDAYVQSENISLPVIEKRERDNGAISSMLRVRMMLSALCDADYTATQAHFHSIDENSIGAEMNPPDFHLAFEYFTEYRNKLIENSTADGRINSLRNDLYHAALSAAAWDSGAFSLTAPTGSGKTLAMLGFALRHALRSGKRRIIFVLPYLTLIEQASKEIRKSLRPLSDDEGYVFEDHSQAREGEAGFAIPNWNQPIIITTTIKFFESLFSNKPSRLRHLHNIADSIVLFDEAQSLPFGYASQTLEALSKLCDKHNVSVVFSTATQPAFDLLTSEWSPREIVPADLNLFGRAQRITISWPQSVETETSWEELAAALSRCHQALTIVNTRRQALKLTNAIKAIDEELPVFHLSTNMCVTHRKNTLDAVRKRLDDGLPCLLISTQCIEAGVDISFPIVYRAMGPLDSVIQAFGRCNRNGERHRGQAHIFLPPLKERGYPDTNYELAAIELMRIIKKSRSIDLDDPKQIRNAFEVLIARMQGEGVKGKYKDFADALIKRNYEAIDEHYRWIDPRGINVIVPYEPQLPLFNELVNVSHGGRLQKCWLNQAQSIGVNVSVPQNAQLKEYLQPILCYYNGESIETGWYYPINNEVYDSTFGLRLDFEDDAENFMC